MTKHTLVCCHLQLGVDVSSYALLQADSSEYGQGKTSNSNPVSVLTLNYKRLKPQDELRRIFGSKIISQEDRSEDSGEFL